MKHDIPLSLFFPAYNEEDNIKESVERARDVLKNTTNTYEIIVVNDGSTDRTGEIADDLSHRYADVRVVHHNPNQGYGGAVLSGLEAAQYEYVFFTDADLQFDLSEITKLLEHVPEYSAVIGYRAKRKDPFMRLVNAKGWNVLNRLLFGLKVRDIDCAFKLFERNIVQSVDVESRGAMMSAELLIRLNRKGVKFKEVPVTHLPREKGVQTGANPLVIARAFKEMVDVFRGELGRSLRRQVAKFAGVGLMNTAIDIGIYVILTRTVPFFAAFILFAKTISFLSGSVFSFITNRQWTFAQTGAVSVGELGRFYSTVLSGLAINVGTVYLFHQLLGFYDLVAVIIATGVTFIWNFTLTRSWVFKKAFA